MSDNNLILLRDFSTLFMELLSAIVALVYYKKYKDSILKYFLYYLWIVVLVEYAAYILREWFDVVNNAYLFNLFFFLSFLFFSFLYHQIIQNKKRKLVVKLCVSFYVVIFIVSGFYENYITDFQSIPFIIASCLFLIFMALYLTELLNSKKVLYIRNNLFFWINLGLLIFYVGSIPFRIAIQYYANIGGFPFLFAINYILIIILNMCYIIGFVWSDKKQLY